MSYKKESENRFDAVLLLQANKIRRKINIYIYMQYIFFIIYF